MSAAIDGDGLTYVWGMLRSADNGSHLCIKQPEKVSSLKVKKIEIGPSMALAIEKQSRIAYVIGINKNGELGVGDTDIRK